MAGVPILIDYCDVVVVLNWIFYDNGFVLL